MTRRRSFPRTRTPKVEVDSTCRDERSGRPASREIGEGDGMRVMRVKECAALPDLGDDRRDDARVESDSPADRVDRHPIFGESLGELGAGTSNHHLLDRAHPG